MAALASIHLPYPFAGDQALFLLGAAALDRGEVLYVDFWDIKQPGIYLFFWLTAAPVWLFGNRCPFSRTDLAGDVHHSADCHTAVLLRYSLALQPCPVGNNHSLLRLCRRPSSYPGGDPPPAAPFFLCLWLSCHPWKTGRACGVAYFAAGCCAATVAAFKLILLPIPTSFWVASAAWAICRTNDSIGAISP